MLPLLGLFLWVLALAFACYSGGAYDATIQRLTCVAAALGFGLLLLGTKAFYAPPRRVVVIASLGAVWCLLVAFQLVPLPESLLARATPWTIRYWELRAGVDGRIGEEPSVTLSLIRGDTVHRLAVYGFALLIFLISAVAINDRLRRMAVLVGITLSSIGIASWGIFQRLLDARDLPPGVPKTNYSDYFAGFSNENTGAACVSLGAAAALGLVLWKFARSASRRSSQSPQTGFKSPEGKLKRKGAGSLSSGSGGAGNSEDGYQPAVLNWSEPTFVLISAAFAFLLASIVMSLSRGAVLSAVVAVSIVLLRVFWSRSWRLAAVLVLLAATITYGALVAFDSQDDLVQVQEELNSESLSLDARWEHWKDGWALVKRFPVTGTGLGTYGFAQLMTQSEDAPGWVREAHNQYLEYLAETGVFGFAMILGGLAYCLFALWKRVPSATAGDVLAVRAAALCGLLAAAIHSFVDFSYAAPSNLWLLACLTGMGLGARSRSSRSLKVNTWQISAGGLVVASGVLCVFWFLSREAEESKVLQATLLKTGQLPSARQADEALSQLQQQDHRQGASALIGLRQATIRLQQFKRANFARESDQDSTVPLRGVTVRGIEQRYYQRLGKIFVARRSDGASESAFAGSAELLEIRDILETVLSSNPLHFRAHFLLGEVVTLLGEDGKVWFERCQMLNRARPEVFYACGLFAYWADDEEAMDQQWRRCLALSRDYDRYILTLVREKVTSDEFASRLAPRQADRLYSFVRSVSRRPEFEPFREPTVARALAAVENSEQLEPATRANQSAHLFVIKGDEESARQQFRLAVTAAPKNLAFRLDLAANLARTGYPEAALQELKIASALAPENSRVDAMILSLRKQILAQ